MAEAKDRRVEEATDDVAAIEARLAASIADDSVSFLFF